jgi:predicted amidohydrolase
MSIFETHEELETLLRRFLRQPQAKSARLVVFPELMGLMLAPPLISGLKLGFIKQAGRGRHPSAGAVTRGVGRVADATAGVLGGGMRGSLGRLLSKNSDALRDRYLETFGGLARETGAVIVAGSIYLPDEITGTIRHRAYVFDVDGSAIGFQDKFNLTPTEQEFAVPGTHLSAIDTRYGRLGIMIGRDALFPEFARLLAVNGADLVIGIAANPGAAPASVFRSALSLRAEENQVYSAACFMLGPNFLDRHNREDYFGQSSLFCPISLSTRGDGVLAKAGSNRTEGIVVADLDAVALDTLRASSRFRPRREMNLGDIGPALADFYQQGQTIEGAIEARAMGLPELEPEPLPHEPPSPMIVPAPGPEETEALEAEAPELDVPEPELRLAEAPELDVPEPELLETEPPEPELREPEAPEPEPQELEPQEPEATALSYSVPEAMAISSQSTTEDGE